MPLAAHAIRHASSQHATAAPRLEQLARASAPGLASTPNLVAGGGEVPACSGARADADPPPRCQAALLVMEGPQILPPVPPAPWQRLCGQALELLELLEILPLGAAWRRSTGAPMIQAGAAAQGAGAGQWWRRGAFGRRVWACDQGGRVPGLQGAAHAQRQRLVCCCQRQATAAVAPRSRPAGHPTAPCPARRCS